MLPKGTLGKIFDYYFGNPEYEEEMLRAFSDFFEKPDLKRGDNLDYHDKSEGFFNEWFLYDFRFLNKKSPLENFIIKNPLGFSPSKMKPYKSILKSQAYGLYEVILLDIGYGLKLRNLQTGDEVYVHEKSLTQQVKLGNSFYARLADVGDRFEIIGADSFMLNFSDTDKKKIRTKLSRIKFTPKFAHKIWSDRQLQDNWENIMGDILKKK